MASEVAKKIADRIILHFHLSVVLFYNNCWMSKPILFRLLTTGFLGGVGLTGKLCRSWLPGCTDFYHWATRTPWLYSCCWSRYHDQTILWTSSKDLLHVFIHDSRRPGATDTRNQGPVGGVDHRKSDSTTNVVFQPDAVIDAITGTRTASWARGWFFYCSCQHKGS